MGKLKVAWLFIIGFLIIVYGFYKLYQLGFPYTEPTGEYSNIFMIMFAGLAVSGIGAAYGRRKLKKQYSGKLEVTEISPSEEAATPQIPAAPAKTTEKTEKTAAKPSEKTKSLVCQKCGEENPPKAKFCEECGSRLSAVCGKCGEENKPSAKFCEECGQKIS